jgi:hypothetical protein
MIQSWGMSDSHAPLTSKQTLLLILVPMLGTFLSMRLYLHLVGVQHIYPGGYLIHHLFTGVLITIPAAFVLAFDVRRRLLAISARLALGAGSAMISDEIVFLVMTKASDDDYISRLSLLGGIGFVSLATILLCILYQAQSK